MKRLPIISDSDYGEWRDRLKLPTSAEQDVACLYLERHGQQFLVNYGYENAILIAAEMRRAGRMAPPQYKRLTH